MTPPIWLDELGKQVPTRPCPRAGCDREWPDYRHRFQHLVMIGLGRPRLVLRIVNWCGHSQDAVPWPGPDGYWRLVPVVESPGAR